MYSRAVRVTVTAAFALCAGTAVQVGRAQDSGANQAGALEEIVVTATRRAQDLQQVPISIVAITGENMELRGIQSPEDMGAATPNLNIQGGGGGTSGTNLAIRGISGTGAVGTYVDGVWQVSSAGMLTQQFTDIDRVEVLRGPQGTTFGRDSTGGAIRIWTKRPTNEYSAEIGATVGSLDRRDANITVNLPVTDKFLTKWTASTFYRDGYIQDLTINQKNGGIDQQVYHGDMLWSPSDKLSFRFEYGTTDSKFTEPRIQDGVFNTAAQQGQQILIKDFYGLAGQLPFDNQHMSAGWPGGEVGKWENRSKISLPTHINNHQASLDVNWDITDTMKLELLTAGTLENNLTYIDWDNSPYDLVDDLDNSRRRVFSEEIQLSGQRGKVSWFGGVYYWTDHLKQRFIRYVAEEFTDGTLDVNTVFNTPTCQAMGFTKNNCEDVFQTTLNQRYDTLQRYNADGYAAFGEATVSLTDSLDLIIGLRYHNQNNDSQSYTPLGANADPSCSGNPGDALGLPAPPTAATPPIALCARPPTTNMQFASGVDMYAGTLLGPETKVNFDKVTSKLALQKQFRAGLMGYISYAEGFNSGGVSTPTISGIRYLYPYEPETVVNSEIGMRSDWADGKLRFNATLFHMTWENIQNLGVVFDAQGNQVPTLVTTNVGKARSQGVEFEFTVAPTEKFLVNVNLGLLDTAYTFIKPGTFSLNTGTEFRQAPQDTYNVGLQYNASMPNGGTLTTRIDYSYSSQFWRSLPFLRMSWYSAVPPNYDESGDTSQLNVRLAYQPPSGNFELAVFGTNLGNTYLLDSGFFHGIWGYDFATVARPREAGVSFNFRF